MTRDRRIRSLVADRAIDVPDTLCQTHGVPFDENRRCPACRLALCAECDFGLLGAGHLGEHVRSPRTTSDDGQELL